MALETTALALCWCSTHDPPGGLDAGPLDAAPEASTDATDAATDAPVPDAAAECPVQPTEQAIGCGAERCAVPIESCCRTGADVDGTILGNCRAAGAACGGWMIDCDDAADCVPGEVCCNGYDDSVSAFRSRCAPPPCGGDLTSYQVCACDAECAPGETCQLQFTKVGGFWSCGPP